MKTGESTSKRRVVGRLEKGDDLAGAIIEVCRFHRITAGEIRALGAVKKLQVTEWDLEKSEYRPALICNRPCEILMLYGNISRKGEEIFPHLHITASYIEKGRPVLVAGHLIKAEVFACEFVIEAFDDLTLLRQPDEPTGLMLWDQIRKKG
jgi:uncharacterized protein